MSQMKGNAKRIVAGVLCATFMGAGAFAVVNAQQQQADFDPSQYANYNAQGDSNVSFDTTLFGGSRQKADGLELDKTKPDDYNLTEGDQNIRDEENAQQDQFQLSIGGGTTAGAGDGGNAAPGIGVGDGSGGTIHGGGTGGTGSGTGTGGGTGSGDDDDGIDYGTDYNTPETVHSSYPTAAEDKNGVNGEEITAKTLTVTGNLQQHFFPGECPRPSEMLKYITVNATMSDGTTRNNLQYCQFAEYGGDYTVTWDENSGREVYEWDDATMAMVEKKASSDCVGLSANNYGETYTATIHYRGMSQTITYDIVTWQLTLYDFDESENVWDFMSNDQCAYPTNSPIVDLTDELANMYSTIDGRFSWEGYQHVYQYDKSLEYIVEYFGGWCEEDGKPPVGTSYKMARPTAADINEDNVYNIDMQPVWSVTGENNDGYYIALQKATWETTLVGYSDAIFRDGDDSNDEAPYTLVVPDGVTAVDMDALCMNGGQFGYSTNGLAKIVLSESVSRLIAPSSERVSYPALTEVSAAAGSESFLSIDGVLYNRTGKELLYFPQAKQEVNKWSNRVEKIGDSAFYNTEISSLTLPETVYIFGEKAFYNATLETLNITTEKQMQWGDSLFGNDVGVTAMKLNITRSLSLPLLTSGNEATCYTFFGFDAIWEGTYSEMRINVPESENDATYLAYLSMLMTNLASYNTAYGGVLGYDVLNHAGATAAKYTVGSDGCVYTAGGATLALVPKGTTGDYTLPATMPDTGTPVTTIGANAFLLCSGIDTIIIPEGVTQIESGAFAGLTGLATIIFQGEDAPTIAPGAFGDITPEGLTIYAGSEDFNYGPALADILAHSTNTTVHYDNAGGTIVDGSVYTKGEDGGYQLVSWNKNATFASLLPGTTTVAADAFDNCTQLVAISFPDTLTTIEDSAFTNCPALEMLCFSGNTAPTLEGTALAEVPAAAECYVPGGKLDAYKPVTDGFVATHDAAQDYEIRQNGTASVALYGHVAAGAGKTDFAAVRYVSGDDGTFYLDADATRVLANAFENRSNISGIDGYAVKQIDTAAFKGCGDILSVDIGYIPVCAADAFDGCTFGSVVLGHDTDDAVDVDTSQLKAFSSAEILGLCMHVNALTGSFAATEWPNLNEVYSFMDAETGWHSTINKLGDGLFKDSTIKVLSLSNLPECGTDVFTGCTGYEVDIGSSVCPLGSVTTQQLAAFSNATYLAFCGQLDELSGSFASWDNLEGFYLLSSQDTNLTGTKGAGGKDVGLFEGNATLQIVYVEPGASLGTVGPRTFASCPLLNNVFINAADVLGDYCFADCPVLGTRNSTYTSGRLQFNTIGTVGAHAFKNCKGITLSQLHVGSIDTLCAYAFNGCTQLRNLNNWTIANIQTDAFNGAGLYGVQLYGVQTAQPGAFNGVTSVTLNGMETIPAGVFANCPGLESVTVSGVTSVGSKAFDNCPDLYEVSIAGEVTYDYSSFPPQPMYGNVSIAADAFTGCDSVTTVTVSNMNTVSAATMANWPALEVLTIDGVQTVESDAFANNPNLYQLTLNGDLVTSAITGAMVPGSITFAADALAGCDALEDVTIADVATLPAGFFANCTALGSVSISGLQTVGSKAFEGCTGLYSVTLNGATVMNAATNTAEPGYIALAADAFTGCTALADVTISWLKTLPTALFADCTGLGNVTITGLTTIESNVFINCTALSYAGLYGTVTGYEEDPWDPWGGQVATHAPINWAADAFAGDFDFDNTYIFINDEQYPTAFEASAEVESLLLDEELPADSDSENSTPESGSDSNSDSNATSGSNSDANSGSDSSGSSTPNSSASTGGSSESGSNAANSDSSTADSGSTVTDTAQPAATGEAQSKAAGSSSESSSGNSSSTRSSTGSSEAQSESQSGAA